MFKTVLVCGGRDYADSEFITKVIKYLRDKFGTTIIVHGNARGADSLARDAARQLGMEDRPYSADWNKHGRAAGPIRNQQMLDNEEIDTVVAFPGGRGTADMIGRAKDQGINVIDFNGVR
jgi:YspA, cpYpsA-related SLOG family